MASQIPRRLAYELAKKKIREKNEIGKEHCTLSQTRYQMENVCENKWQDVAAVRRLFCHFCAIDHQPRARLTQTTPQKLNRSLTIEPDPFHCVKSMQSYGFSRRTMQTRHNLMGHPGSLLEIGLLLEPFLFLWKLSVWWGPKSIEKHRTVIRFFINWFNLCAKKFSLSCL